jgi:ABC-type lipoprotein release transport system permease subunit
MAAAFYERGYELVNIGLLIAGSLAAGLLVSLSDSVMERRRSLAALVAAGTPVATLRLAVILQGVLPLVPAVLLAMVLGGSAFYVITDSTVDMSNYEAGATAFPWGDLAIIALVGIVASVLATALSLPFLNRSIRLAELRFE